MPRIIPFERREELTDFGRFLQGATKGAQIGLGMEAQIRGMNRADERHAASMERAALEEQRIRASLAETQRLQEERRANEEMQTQALTDMALGRNEQHQMMLERINPQDPAVAQLQKRAEYIKGMAAKMSPQTAEIFAQREMLALNEQVEQVHRQKAGEALQGVMESGGYDEATAQKLVELTQSEDISGKDVFRTVMQFADSTAQQRSQEMLAQEDLTNNLTRMQQAFQAPVPPGLHTTRESKARAMTVMERYKMFHRSMNPEKAYRDFEKALYAPDIDDVAEGETQRMLRAAQVDEAGLEGVQQRLTPQQLQAYYDRKEQERESRGMVGRTAPGGRQPAGRPETSATATEPSEVQDYQSLPKARQRAVQRQLGEVLLETGMSVEQAGLELGVDLSQMTANELKPLLEKAKKERAKRQKEEQAEAEKGFGGRA